MKNWRHPFKNCCRQKDLKHQIFKVRPATLDQNYFPFSHGSDLSHSGASSNQKKCHRARPEERESLFSSLSGGGGRQIPSTSGPPPPEPARRIFSFSTNKGRKERASERGWPPEWRLQQATGTHRSASESNRHQAGGHLPMLCAARY